MSPYVLLQFGDNPLSNKFEDLEGRPAFLVTEVEEDPNLVVQVARQAHWAQQHPDIKGPKNAYLYFGPSRTQGYLVYGNGPPLSMSDYLIKQKKNASMSRYFTAQDGNEYKWKITSERMECLDGRTTLAVWERSRPEDEYYAILTIKHASLAIVTEMVTALSLNCIALALQW